MDTTKIAAQIAELHFAADFAALADGEALDADMPIAMMTGVWDLEQDLLDIDSKLIASDLDKSTIEQEIIEAYRALLY